MNAGPEVLFAPGYATGVKVLNDLPAEWQGDGSQRSLFSLYADTIIDKTAKDTLQQRLANPGWRSGAIFIRTNEGVFQPGERRMQEHQFEARYLASLRPSPAVSAVMQSLTNRAAVTVSVHMRIGVEADLPKTTAHGTFDNDPEYKKGLKVFDDFRKQCQADDFAIRLLEMPNVGSATVFLSTDLPESIEKLRNSLPPSTNLITLQRPVACTNGYGAARSVECEVHAAADLMLLASNPGTLITSHWSTFSDFASVVREASGRLPGVEACDANKCNGAQRTVDSNWNLLRRTSELKYLTLRVRNLTALALQAEESGTLGIQEAAEQQAQRMELLYRARANSATAAQRLSSKDSPLILCSTDNDLLSTARAALKPLELSDEPPQLTSAAEASLGEEELDFEPFFQGLVPDGDPNPQESRYFLEGKDSRLVATTLCKSKNIILVPPGSAYPTGPCWSLLGPHASKVGVNLALDDGGNAIREQVLKVLKGQLGASAELAEPLEKASADSAGVIVGGEDGREEEAEEEAEVGPAPPAEQAEDTFDLLAAFKQYFKGHLAGKGST